MMKSRYGVYDDYGRFVFVLSLFVNVSCMLMFANVANVCYCLPMLNLLMFVNVFNVRQCL